MDGSLFLRKYFTLKNLINPQKVEEKGLFKSKQNPNQPNKTQPTNHNNNNNKKHILKQKIHMAFKIISNIKAYQHRSDMKESSGSNLIL